MKKRLLFIVNPISGVGRQRRIEKILLEYIDHSQYRYAVQYTQYIHHGTELAAEAVAKNCYDAVIAVGGDGSVNDVAAGLRGSDMVMGIIPCGSGNGLARNMKIPLKPSLAVHHINRFHVEEIDTVDVNGHLFVSIAGVGFDALVAREMKQAKTRGLQAYTKIMLSTYPNYNEHTYNIIVDGVPMQRKAWFISLANSNQFGYNTAIAPLAKLDDGLLDVCIVDKIPITHLPITMQLVYANHFELSQHVEIFKAKDVIINNNDDLWVNIDGEGEELGDKLHFSIQPHSLKIISHSPTPAPELIKSEIEGALKKIR
ncbi:MAG: hypothetical protein IJU81_06960 [Bacteroidales bacterium]|nr:hypothetical protein [Bacteroidales bacterium]